MPDKPSMSRQDFLRNMAAGLSALSLGSKDGGWAEIPQPFATTDLSLPYRLKPVAGYSVAFTQMRGLCFDSSNQLLVATENGIHRLDQKGQAAPIIPLPSPAMSVAANEEGSISVLTRGSALLFDSHYQPLSDWEKPRILDNPDAWLVSATMNDRSVFVSDAGNRKVFQIALNGDLIQEIDGFHIPSAYFPCALNSDGSLLVGHTSRHQVEIFDAQGELQTSWGTYGSSPERFCGCCNPTNLAVYRKDWIATAEKGIPRVKINNPEGKLLAYLSAQDLGLHEEQSYLNQLRRGANGELPCHDGWPGMPMAFDSQGRLAVALPGLKTIRIYEIA
jgi:hypothetical protein